MAQYFNRESGSLAITLRSGTVCSIPGKSWVEIPSSEEGSEDLIRIMQKGYVYRFAIEEVEAQAAAPAEVVQAPKVEAAPVDVPLPDFMNPAKKAKPALVSLAPATDATSETPKSEKV